MPGRQPWHQPKTHLNQSTFAKTKGQYVHSEDNQTRQSSDTPINTTSPPSRWRRCMVLVNDLSTIMRVPVTALLVWDALNRFL